MLKLESLETLPDTRYLHATGTSADTNERVVVSHGTVSLPLAAGENRNVAVKVVDDRGIESLGARFTMANSLIPNSPYDPPTLYWREKQNRAKLAAMRTWVDAVNAKGGLGRWCCDVVYEMAKMQDVLTAHGG